MFKIKLSAVILIAVYIAACGPSEKNVIEDPVKATLNQNNNQTLADEKVIEEELNKDKEVITKNEKVIKEEVVDPDIDIDVAAKIVHPSEGFLFGANKAEPWKAYQNYDQLPSRFGDDPFFLWSFKLNKGSDILRPF